MDVGVGGVGGRCWCGKMHLRRPLRSDGLLSDAADDMVWW